MSALAPGDRRMTQSETGKKFVISLEAQPVVMVPPRSPMIGRHSPNPTRKVETTTTVVQTSRSPRPNRKVQETRTFTQVAPPRSPNPTREVVVVKEVLARSSSPGSTIPKNSSDKNNLNERRFTYGVEQVKKPNEINDMKERRFTSGETSLVKNHPAPNAAANNSKAETHTVNNNLHANNNNNNFKSSSLPSNKKLTAEDMEHELQRMYGGLPKGTGIHAPHHEGHSEFCSCKVKGNFYE